MGIFTPFAVWKTSPPPPVAPWQNGPSNQIWAAAVAQKGERGGTVSKTSVKKHCRRLFWERRGCVLVLFHIWEQICSRMSFIHHIISNNSPLNVIWRARSVFFHWRECYALFLFSIFYQNACYRCKNAENRTWSEFFYYRQSFGGSV